MEFFVDGIDGHTTSSDLSESVSIFISFLSILDIVCISVHKLTNDTTGLVGGTLSINTCEGK